MLFEKAGEQFAVITVPKGGRGGRAPSKQSDEQGTKSQWISISPRRLHVPSGPAGQVQRVRRAGTPARRRACAHAHVCGVTLAAARSAAGVFGALFLLVAVGMCIPRQHIASAWEAPSCTSLRLRKINRHPSHSKKRRYTLQLVKEGTSSDGEVDTDPVSDIPSPAAPPPPSAAQKQREGEPQQAATAGQDQETGSTADTATAAGTEAAAVAAQEEQCPEEGSGGSKKKKKKKNKAKAAAAGDGGTSANGVAHHSADAGSSSQPLDAQAADGDDEKFEDARSEPDDTAADQRRADEGGSGQRASTASPGGDASGRFDPAAWESYLAGAKGAEVAIGPLGDAHLAAASAAVGPALRSTLSKHTVKGEDKWMQAPDNKWTPDGWPGEHECTLLRQPAHGGLAVGFHTHCMPTTSHIPKTCSSRLQLHAAAASFAAFGVFDGHGGSEASSYAARALVQAQLKECLETVAGAPPAAGDDAEADPEAASIAAQDALIERLPKVRTGARGRAYAVLEWEATSWKCSLHAHLPLLLCAMPGAVCGLHARRRRGEAPLPQERHHGHAGRGVRLGAADRQRRRQPRLPRHGARDRAGVGQPPHRRQRGGARAHQGRRR